MGLQDFDDPNLDVFNLPGSNYGFSATKMDKLTAPMYTLATLLLDDSGSVHSFVGGLENCARQIILSLRDHDRADFLLVRVVAFGSQMREVIGYTLLADINLSVLDNFLGHGGGTYLFGACKNSLDAANAYGKQLFDAEYKVNGLTYVVTDGDDTCSDRDGITASDVGTALKAAVKSEALESMSSILVGVNMTDPSVKSYLDNFAKTAGFDKFLSLDGADADSLRRVIQAGHQSISLTSQALGSGGPSQQIQSLTI
jgi:uncharacterized protein YegL